MQARRTHWIPHNAKTALPRDWLYLDTEAHEHDGVQRFRLGCVLVDREPRVPIGDADVYAAHHTADLWSYLTAMIRPRRRAVLVCHNLAYDLRLSRALWELPARGFTLTSFAFDGPTCWLSWQRDKRDRLIMVDTMSWAPKALKTLGDLVGIQKPPLPEWDDSDAAWVSRCDADVRITAEVWRRAMGFVEREDLGMWKPTGAGQSFAAWRHRFKRHNVLASDQTEVRALERAAAWSGRCEAWRWGEQPGPWHEWDMNLAYARIGAECDVPTRYIGEGHTFDPKKCAILADAVVSTDEPTVPALQTDDEGATHPYWPVGRFDTVAWLDELALRTGSCRIRVAHVYERAPALREFCTWLIDIVENGDADPIERLIAKHWCRAFIGRFGTRYPRWEPFGEASDVDVALSDAINGDSKQLHRMLHLGKQLLIDSELVDGEHTLPAVMSWVMAECRVRLWHVMVTAGLENLAYVDTDSAIVNEEGSRRLEAAAIPHLRVKGSWQHVEVLGPRQLLLGGELRAAGVPRAAARVGDRSWHATVWSGLEGDLSRRSADRVTLTERHVELAGVDRRRLHLPDGLTEAIRV